MRVSYLILTPGEGGRFFVNIYHGNEFLAVETIWWKFPQKIKVTKLEEALSAYRIRREQCLT